MIAKARHIVLATQGAGANSACARHVLGDGGRPVRPSAAAMRCDARAAVRDLDRGGGDPCLDLHMVVEVDPAALPLGIFVGFGRQRLQQRAIELLEERSPAHPGAAHRSVVETVEQDADRGIEVGEREEPLVPRPRQESAPAPDEPAAGR